MLASACFPPCFFTFLAVIKIMIFKLFLYVYFYDLAMAIASKLLRIFVQLHELHCSVQYEKKLFIGIMITVCSHFSMTTEIYIHKCVNAHG